MRKAALLYNPESGGSKRRQRDLESALGVLRSAGVAAELIPTGSRQEGGEAARNAIASGCDTIFACGGDGTIHNLLHVVANSPAALAILPMGTANALAHDIGLPLNVVGAAKAALRATPRRIALGQIRCINLQGSAATSYFTVAAGMGIDAHLFYRLRTSEKQRMGMAAYYMKCWNLWFTYPMPRFLASYVATGSDVRQSAEVTELLSVRIRNFGGVVHELAPGASLDRDDMRLIVCRTASRFWCLCYVTRCVLQRAWKIPAIDLVHSTSVSCDYLQDHPAQQRIYVEADGELIGTLPAEIEMVPNALTLLVPAR